MKTTRELPGLVFELDKDGLKITSAGKYCDLEEVIEVLQDMLPLFTEGQVDAIGNAYEEWSRGNNMDLEDTMRALRGKRD